MQQINAANATNKQTMQLKFQEKYDNILRHKSLVQIYKVSNVSIQLFSYDGAPPHSWEVLKTFLSEHQKVAAVVKSYCQCS